MGVVANALKAQLTKFGHKPAFMISYDNSMTDFKPLLSKAQESSPRGIALLGYDTLGTAMKQMREMGLSAQIYGLTTLLSEGGRALAGAAAEGARAALWLAPPSPELEEFRRKLKKRIKRELLPDFLKVPSYDAAFIIAEGLKAGGYRPDSKSIDTDKMLRFIQRPEGFAGVCDHIFVDPEGMAQGFNDAKIKVVKGGVLVDPEE